MGKLRCINCNKEIDITKPYYRTPNWRRENRENVCSKKCAIESADDKGYLFLSNCNDSFPKEITNIKGASSYGQLVCLLEDAIELAESGLRKNEHDGFLKDVDILLQDMKEIVNLLETLKSIL